MLTEMMEYRHKIEEKVKAMQNEKEKINMQLEQNKETRIQKNDERLRNHWDNFKCSNIQTLAAPERRKSKNMKTYLKN